MEPLRECLDLFISLWLGVIGALLGLTGKLGIVVFTALKDAGVWLVEFSFKFDNY